MAGLNLQLSGYAGNGSAKLASVPAAATSAGSGPVSIGTRAFGIGTSQTAEGPATAGFGAVALGLAGAAVLAYLWWSLPR